MNPEFTTELLKNMILNAVLIAAPFLGVAMAVGLLVSLFQAITGINEQTLSFVPKVGGIVLLMILLMPWMMRSLMEFAVAVLEKLPQMTQ